jgi:hypothetical protein
MKCCTEVITLRIMQITTRVAAWFCVSPHCNDGRIFVQLGLDLLPLVAVPIIRPQRGPKAIHGSSERPECLSITTLTLNALRFTSQQTFVKKP